MAQVIIVSNRLPISVKKDKGKLVFSESLGGLATGLSSYVSDNRGSLWIGWPGIPSDELSKEDKIVISDYLSKESYVPVFLNQKQIDNFYNGYSNSILWPLFHGLRYKNYDPKKLKIWWQAYQSINRRYSDAVSSVAKDKSRIWVHDYQLLLVPEILRKEKPSLNVGFFLHIPFPTPKQYLKLHEGKKLILGILGADLIGFHTASYVENFIDATKEFSLGEQLGDQINIDDRFVRIAQFPMGIDYEKFVEARKLQDVKEAVKRYEKKYRRLRVIASVDRLDPSKGLVERLNAYSKFLEINPRMRGKVVFTMIAAPSRTSIKEYQSLSRRLKKLAQEINDTYAYKKWLPVDYINEAMPFEEVNALFQIADVAFITPLRDGMNLTAKEFVASNKRNGVLILSETAGAADELEDAIKVDPKDQGDLVRALGIALRMRKREHRQRLKRMRRSISANTVQSWSQTFLETLQQPLPSPRRLTKGLSKNHLKKLMVRTPSSQSSS
jgi:trehalose 6-phosphate synthase/phosphatase